VGPPLRAGGWLSPSMTLVTSLPVCPDSTAPPIPESTSPRFHLGGLCEVGACGSDLRDLKLLGKLIGSSSPPHPSSVLAAAPSGCLLLSKSFKTALPCPFALAWTVVKSGAFTLLLFACIAVRPFFFPGLTTFRKAVVELLTLFLFSLSSVVKYLLGPVAGLSS